MPRYDWGEIQRFYDDGHSFRECRERFGFAAQAWTKAVQRGALVPRPRLKRLAIVLSSKSSPQTKKRKLLREGLLEAACSACGIRDWLGRPLALQIDHIDGNRNNWRVENLRLLCPNCHSQTETFAGRNAGRYREARLHEDSGFV